MSKEESSSPSPASAGWRNRGILASFSLLLLFAGFSPLLSAESGNSAWKGGSNALN